MTTEQQTFYNLRITSADGKIDTAEYKSEKQANELKAEAAKQGSQVEELKAQTFTVSRADSVDEILSVTPNADVALSYYNYGLTLAQHGIKRDLMTDPDWQPVDGSYDLLADVQQPKEKRVADPLSAGRRSLRAFWAKNHPGAEPPTDAEIDAVLLQFAGAAQPTAA